MLFDPAVTEARGSHKQATGFKILQHSLFLACAQDIAKLCLDADERTPSIRNLITCLEDSSLCDELRERYAVWRIPSVEKKTDPRIIAALERMEQREESARREQFDQHCNQLLASWESLSTSKALTGFLTVRDKVSAHTEVRFVADKYQLVDIGALGITWGEMKSTIQAMQELIGLLGLIVRNADFAWDMLARQLSEAANGFWST